MSEKLIIRIFVLEISLFLVFLIYFCIFLVGINRSTPKTKRFDDNISEIKASLPKSQTLNNKEPQNSIIKKDIQDDLDEIKDSSKNKRETKINDLNNANKYIKLNSQQEKIKIFLEKRNITTLIHFTDSRNLKNILHYSLLSVEVLNDLRLIYCYNDDKRLDGMLNYISLSVTKPNYFLLKSFIKQLKIKNPFLIEIDASMLWKEDNKRIYCQTNAATSGLKKGSDIQDFEAMFEQSVRYHTSSSNKNFSRSNKTHKDNETTDAQAEILWSSKVLSQYFVRYYPYSIKEFI